MSVYFGVILGALLWYMSYPFPRFYEPLMSKVKDW